MRDVGPRWFVIVHFIVHILFLGTLFEFMLFMAPGIAASLIAQKAKIMPRMTQRQFNTGVEIVTSNFSEIFRVQSNDVCTSYCCRFLNHSVQEVCASLMRTV